MPIYTKRGDEGETDLWNMDRVSKAGPRVEAYGTVDELNTVVGAVRPTGHDDLDGQLSTVQNDLFVVQADLANPDSGPDGDDGAGHGGDDGAGHGDDDGAGHGDDDSTGHGDDDDGTDRGHADDGTDRGHADDDGDDSGGGMMTATVDRDRVDRLEGWIDDHEDDLEELTAFVLPGGDETGAALHNARAVCRRAERRTVALAREEPINPAVLAYLNRLSDYLFVLARTANARAGVPEENPTY